MSELLALIRFLERRGRSPIGWFERWTHGRRERFWIAGCWIEWSVRAQHFAMAAPIGPGRVLDSPRLSPRRVLPLREQRFALDLKQARFDRTGTAKSPQEVC